MSISVILATGGSQPALMIPMHSAAAIVHLVCDMDQIDTTSVADYCYRQLTIEQHWSWGHQPPAQSKIYVSLLTPQSLTTITPRNPRGIGPRTPAGAPVPPIIWGQNNVYSRLSAPRFPTVDRKHYFLGRPSGSVG